LNRPIY